MGLWDLERRDGVLNRVIDAPLLDAIRVGMHSKERERRVFERIRRVS